MTFLDACLTALGRSLRGVSSNAPAQRPSPAAGQPEPQLDDRERRHAAALMRVNHCGEICAQALYEGQAATAREDIVRDSLAAAAQEEADHLTWCRERLTELDEQPSKLDPAFYHASYLLGTLAGLLGDRISLGLVAATEDEVRRHLERHLEALPPTDSKSRAILLEMRNDEMQHERNAERAGALLYPKLVKRAMRLASKTMTATTYRI